MQNNQKDNQFRDERKPLNTILSLSGKQQTAEAS